MNRNLPKPPQPPPTRLYTAYGVPIKNKDVGKMFTRKSWDEFRDAGFLWLINTTLHLFGWAIVIKTNNDNTTEVFPARVKFRGFTEDGNTEGYKKVSKYLLNNIADIEKETNE
jgi:hypothetical protein